MSVKKMSLYCLFVGLMVLTSSNVIGQALDQKNFGYYFFVNGQMYDIRDFSNVQTQLQAGELVEHSGMDTFSIHSSNKNELAFYNKNGEKFNKVKFYDNFEALSADHSSLLFLEENDLWIKDIDPVSGVAEPRRLTNTGVIYKNTLSLSDDFKSNRKYWYKDKIFFTVSGDNNLYQVNVKSGALSIYENRFPMDHFLTNKSPDNRFIAGGKVTSNDQKSYCWDMETDETYELFPAGYRYNVAWFNNGRALFIFEGQDPNHRGLRNYSFMSYNFLQGESEIRMETKTPGLLNYHLLAVEDGKSICFSPSNRHLCLSYTSHPDHERAVFIFDLESQTRETVLTGEDAFAPGRYNTAFKWINDNQFIYAIDGSSLLNRGTFIYSVEEGKKQKVSPLVATALWPLKGTKYVLFFANSKLYRVKSDGSDLKEFPHRLGYSNNISLLLK